MKVNLIFHNSCGYSNLGILLYVFFKGIQLACSIFQGQSIAGTVAKNGETVIENDSLAVNLEICQIPLCFH